MFASIDIILKSYINARLWHLLHEKLHHIDLLSTLYDPKSGHSDVQTFGRAAGRVGWLPLLQRLANRPFGGGFACEPEAAGTPSRLTDAQST